MEFHAFPQGGGYRCAVNSLQILVSVRKGRDTGRRAPANLFLGGLHIQAATLEAHK